MVHKEEIRGVYRDLVGKPEGETAQKTKAQMLQWVLKKSAGRV
jgi:hypothetical protein